MQQLAESGSGPPQQIAMGVLAVHREAAATTAGGPAGGAPAPDDAEGLAEVQ